MTSPEVTIPSQAARGTPSWSRCGTTEAAGRGAFETSTTVPPPARNLLKTAAVRLRAAAANIDLVETEGKVLRFRRGGDFIMIGHRHPRLDSEDPALKLRQILTLLQQL